MLLWCRGSAGSTAATSAYFPPVLSVTASLSLTAFPEAVPLSERCAFNFPCAARRAFFPAALRWIATEVDLPAAIEKACLPMICPLARERSEDRAKRESCAPWASVVSVTFPVQVPDPVHWRPTWTALWLTGSVPPT